MRAREREHTHTHLVSINFSSRCHCQAVERVAHINYVYPQAQARVDKLCSKQTVVAVKLASSTKANDARAMLSSLMERYGSRSEHGLCSSCRN